MAGRGAKPGERRGGRGPGTPNKRNVDVLEALRAKKFNPLHPYLFWAEVLAGRTLYVRTVINEMGVAVEVKTKPTLDQRMAAAKELAQYVAPKLKAIEHSGKDGESLSEVFANAVKAMGAGSK